MLINRYQLIVSPQFSSSIEQLNQVIAQDIGRIAWNIFLALIPLTLSFFLFYKPRSRLFCWSIYSALGISFVVGIKKYNDGNFLQALKEMIASLWGVRAIFLALSISLLVGLIILDTKFRAPQAKSRSLYWWMGLLPFIVILPNAPYILTDIVHFYDNVRNVNSVWSITLAIVPIYIIFIGSGWLAYVCSLVNIDRYLIEYNLDRYTNIIELSLHLLCAIGIYIGRFIRFNSWSIITQPQQIFSLLPRELIGKFPIVVILITFVIVTMLYAIFKPIVEKSWLYAKV
jgi:uncharacterized membrane protein